MGSGGKGQGRKVFKDIGLKNLPNIMKIRNLQIQEAKENLRKETKENDITTKLLKTRGKKKI